MNSGLDFNVRVSHAVDADAEARRSRVRRVYGRGFVDAARLCGRDPGELMNEAKVIRGEQALTAIAHKVYDAIPFDVAVERHEIMKEMHRTIGTVPDQHTVDGCIVDLLQRHLIREGPMRHFQRMAPKRPTVVITKPAPAAEPQQPNGTHYVPPPMPMSASIALEKYGDLAKQLRAFADTVEGYGIAVAEQLQHTSEELDELHQLDDLLAKRMARKQ